MSDFLFDFSILKGDEYLSDLAKAEEIVCSITDKSVSEVSTFIKSKFNEKDLQYVFQMIIHAASIRPHQWNTLANLWRSIGMPQTRFDFSLFTAFLASRGILNTDLMVSEKAPEQAIKIAENVYNSKIQSEVEKALFADDLMSFEKIKNPQFVENVSLISLAAMHGASKCFKHLMEQSQEVTEETLKCAAKGGNVEILEALNDQISSKNIKDILETAIIYHRNEACQWLINKLPKGAEISLFTCASSFNTIAMVYMVKRGLAKPSERSQVYPHLPILKYLIEKKWYSHAKFILSYSSNCLVYAKNILDEAVNSGNDEVVDFLVKNGKFEVNSFTLVAAANGQVGILKKLVESGATITNDVVMKAVSSGILPCYTYTAKKCPSFNIDQAMLTAIEFGRSNLVIHLFNKIAKDGNEAEKLSAFLIAAVQSEQVEIVEQLLQMKADPNSTDKKGVSALMHAVKSENKKIVQLLVLNGADVNKQTKDGKTALILAAANKGAKILQFLCRRGAKVNLAAVNGLTPLMEASECGKVDSVDVLLQWSVSIDAAKPDTGETALMLASFKGNDGVVSLLCQKGASVDAKSKDGKTALFYAALGGQVETMKILLGKGAKIDSVDVMGLTPLWYTRIQSKSEALEFLVENGADLNHKAPDGRNILMQIEKDDRSAEASTKYLISKGADVNAVDNYGNSPLIIAARTQKQWIVKYLVEAGADIDFADKNGITALMISAYDDQVGTIKYLIRKGANLFLKSGRGMNALDYAKARGNDDVADLIQTAMDKKK